ncbi:MAG: hypothetical protein JJ883_05105 [Thalassospira sp.]|nr:hypothetical protein [Thalassospira sp.]MBO6839848.1 hypothetical protein [Thalassospira sp.]
MKRLLCTILLSLVVLPSANADTGNDLLSMCSDSRDEAQLYCVTYINGIVDGLSIVPNKTFCAPTGVDWRQVRDISIEYINGLPEFRHVLAAILVNSAMTEAFPCQN